MPSDFYFQTILILILSHLSWGPPKPFNATLQSNYKVSFSVFTLKVFLYITNIAEILGLASFSTASTLPLSSWISLSFPSVAPLNDIYLALSSAFVAALAARFLSVISKFIFCIYYPTHKIQHSVTSDLHGTIQISLVRIPFWLFFFW